MLKVLYQKLRLKCKGSLNHNNYSNLSKLQIRRVGKLHTIGRYIVQGIPVLSIFALVGIVCFGILNIDNNLWTSSAYAVGLDEHACVIEGPAGQEEVWDELTKQCINLTTPNCGTGFAWNAVTKQCCIDSSASLTIGGAGETEQVPAGRGVTTYRSHTVRVAANNVSNYGLVITGPSNLTSPSDSTVITGISNQTGLEMDSSNAYDDTWGYGWGDTNTSDSNLTYRTLSPTGTDILTVNGTNDKPALVDRAVDFTKKLVFAVKFSEDAIPGRYYANVTLSLTATPSTLTTYSITYNGNGNTGGTVPAKQSIDLYDTTSYNGFTAAANTGNLTKTGYNFLGWSESSTATSAQYKVGDAVSLTQASPSKTLYAVWELAFNDFPASLTTMQGMTADICKAADVGATKTLTDTRDNNTYTVAKLADGNCWMTQNLRITKESLAANGKTRLTTSDSDVGGNYELIASDKTKFVSSNTGAAIYYENTVYGAYYSWCAVTAGCKSASGSNPGANVNAAYSICPKNWRLPTGGTNGDLQKLYNLNTTVTGGAVNGKNGYYMGGTWWPNAGNALNGTVWDGQYGAYWTATASNANQAYRMFLGSSVQISGSDFRYNGMTVRCIFNS